ncbi:MAG: flagellar basal body rod protein FlgB [Planctomycetes bacterium]|nr:flagellar basal body rod protein FlgB [Planctomycetota bacterium]
MDLTSAGAIPAMEASLHYAWKRHEVILNNIANASTPGFQAQDLPVADFQAAMQKALGQGQRRPPVVLGDLSAASPTPSAFHADARLFQPIPTGGIAGHDGNNVVPETEAAKMAKNSALFTAMTQLLSRQYDLIEKAIKERL